MRCIAAAVVSAIAVILGGAAAIVRIDQRLIVSRTTTRKLLDEGWRFVGGREPYRTMPTNETFGLFMNKVIEQLDEYLLGTCPRSTESVQDASNSVV